MAAPPATVLSPTLVRRGEAKPADPDVAAAAAPPVPMVQEAMQLASLAKAAPKPPAAPAPAVAQPREPTAVDLRPVPLDTVERKPLNFRAPLPHAEALRMMTFQTRQSQQDILTAALDAALTAWNPEWRKLVP